MKYLIGVFTIFIFSCSEKNTIPQDVLKPEIMQKVTWDMLQADELAIQNKNADSTISLINESFRLYEQVFAVHKTTCDQYYKSYRYYQQHPSLYKSMMDGVRKIGEQKKKATTITSPK